MSAQEAEKRVNLKLDAPLHKKLKAKAAIEGRSIQDVLVGLVQAYVKPGKERKS